MSEQRRQEWISKRAYSLWEEAGRPNGRDSEHWAQAVAEREALERTQASIDGQEVLVRFRPRRPTPTTARRIAGVKIAQG